MRRALAAIVSLAALPACGLDLLGDYEPGGAANLPTSGAGPYLKLPADPTTPVDEPFVLTDRAAHLADPAVIALDDGGFRLWFTRTPVDGGASTIATAELGDLGEPPRAAPAVALAADQAWEAGAVAHPAVLARAGGTLELYYQGGGQAGGDAPAIGRATSSDGGASWQKDPANPLLADAATPAVIELGGRVLLYHSVPGSPAVHVAEIDDSGAAVPLGPVLEPRASVKDAFDAIAITDPGVTVVPTLDRAEPERVVLLATGVRLDGGDPVESIGFAGSHDGEAFERPGIEAVLAPNLPSEGGAAVVVTPTRAVLFFHEPYRSRLAIGVALSGD